MIKNKVLLNRYSTIGIGSLASHLVQVTSIQEMIQALHFSQKEGLECVVIGRGSNCIFSDKPFNGLVIINKISFFEHKENIIYVGAGFRFSTLGAKMSQKGYSGLEFAAAIPGSVGGAIFMNAGASGQETRDCVTRVSYINEKLELINRKVKNSDFSYRSSFFSTIKATIVGAEFCLTKDASAKNRQKEILDKRVLSQPYDSKSAGCMFKNPEGLSAGALIDSCGLKGMRVGGAAISLKHANFLINLDNASFRDAQTLIQIVMDEVFKLKGVRLEKEVCFLL